MNIIKRNGEEVVFNIQKIINAITKANNTMPDANRLTEKTILKISETVMKECSKQKRALNVEEIQNLVEDELMSIGAYEIARRYIIYKYKRSQERQANIIFN